MTSAKKGTIMKLAHARLVTNDVAALIDFYRNVTRMASVGDDRYAEFHGPQLTLAISSQRMINVYGASATAPQSNRSVILDFEVADVDAEHARLRDLVGEFVQKPATQPWGNRSMLFRDPDGNLINFFAPSARAAREVDIANQVR